VLLLYVIVHSSTICFAIRYPTCRSCVSAIWKEAGIKGLYRGIGFTLIRAAPVAATILPIYEFTRDAIVKYT
jgi:solute carrier family 25 carnitine/acylcarnitine transporter 20/29